MHKNPPEKDFFIEIAKKDTDGTQILYSSSERLAMGTSAAGTDIWGGAATIIPVPDQINGESLSVVSNSTADTLAGTGAQKVEVHYLDVNWLPASEIVEMDGITAVNLDATNVKFIQYVHVAQIGSNTVAVGNISVYQTGTPATEYNMIVGGGNMSLTTSRMIPANKYGLLVAWTSGVTGGKSTSIKLRATSDHGTLLNGNDPVFLFKDVASLFSSTYLRQFKTPIYLPPKTMVKCSAWTSNPGADCSASFEIVLINT